MARFVAGAQFDIEAFLLNSNLAEFFEFATVSGTDTRVTFTDRFDGIVERLVLIGTFGNYVDGYPTTGTIATAGYSITGGEQFTFTGLSMSVAEFTGYVQTNDVFGLFTALLAGNDVVVGSGSDDVLYGFAGDDTINGRDGADRMVGMAGDDRYIVNNAGDTVYRARWRRRGLGPEPYRLCPA